MDIHIDFDAIPVMFGSDGSGEITAFNDDLRVMAIGADEGSAAARFRDAVAFQVEEDLSQGRPLPEPLRPLVKVLARA